ncbi:NAD(P)-dependent oxidoreductase [Shewanella hafniensis]|uniref:dTDP-4-dehydrorhamnose reductase n=1 Tax=Shewanella hafniensis TaxID=365590 RepID=UPI001BC16372|nr:dTDP-4-dehydrorhamnose reductase [Shewanella hafniensis]MCL1133013.1 dTDP-4-dehydrorhamnose reductase [Shewanella hafniensis]GIU37030.1 NAD(P)-dependent oxidoreductase [Shewanella hafniensis]
MKILVTGSNGQVGSCLVKQLTELSEIECLAVDRDQLDITDRDAVNKLVNEFKPDAIINAAAHTAVDKAEQEVELSYSINRYGPEYLAQAANSVGASILHISTDYVFAGDKEGSYVETDAVAPQGVYGHSKLAGEQAVAAACPRYIILRTAWVFCETGNNFVKSMLRLAQSRDELGVVADQFGSPTYAGDIAHALIVMVQALYNGSTAYGIYHFSGMPHVSWQQFAVEIFKQAKAQGLLNKEQSKDGHKEMQVNAITSDQYPTPAKRPANSKLDCQKIDQAFGIKPSDWQSALKQLASYQ